MMRSFVFLALCSLLLAARGFCQPSPYRFNYLTVDVGLSHTDANELIQDHEGYIWIATHFGLDRFDGYNIKRFYNTTEPLNNALNNRLRALASDDDGNIWLGTEGGFECFNSRTEQYINYVDPQEKIQPTINKLLHEKGVFYGLTDRGLRIWTIDGHNNMRQISPVLPVGLDLRDMACDSSGTIYFCSNKGVWTVNQHGAFRLIPTNGYPEQDFNQIAIDNHSNIVLSAANRLFLTHSFRNEKPADIEKLQIVREYDCPNGSIIKSFASDKKCDYWVSIGPGLIRLDSSFRFVQEVNKKSSLTSLNSSSLNKLYIDRSQCLWVCTYSSGVNYCDLNEKKFYTFQHNPEVPNSLSGNYIRSILEEDNQYMWIGTTYNGLNRYDSKTQKFTFYNTTSSPVKLKDDDIASLVLDNDKNLWIGSGSGIEILKPNRTELWKPRGSESFPTHVIETMAKDCFGNIWFGDHINAFGVIWKDKTGGFHVKYYGEGYFILADSTKPELFVSSTHGLKRLFIDNEGNITKTYTYQATGNPNSLSSNYTYPVCKQNDTTYWVGTIGGGLDRLILRKDDTYEIKAYSTNAGVFADVEGLEIDDQGNIWMGGNGLLCLNPATNKLIRYDKNDGLQGNSFKVNASYKAQNGQLFFGGINGLNFFNPAEINSNMVPAKPILTDLLVNNQKPVYGQPDSSGNSFPEIVTYDNKLKLNYLQNNFVLSFSSMHFANPLKCRYRYKLTGFDKDWKYTDGRNPTAAYSNLDYNDYQFVVEATNNDGLWSSNQATINITVTPPWWKTPLAKWIYAALAIAGLLWIYIYQARWYRLKRELAVRAVNENKREEMHKQREELYQQQLQFFTNISHEFRTPLTLILGPLETLLKENKNSLLNNSYQLMFRNVKRLINLINELMNFKKVADSAIRLQVQSLNVNQFCKNLYHEFENLALSKDLEFKLIDHTIAAGGEPISNSFDSQILEKILFNLLNNAIKYTNPGGQVRLELFFNRDEFKPSFDTEFHLLNEQHRASKYIYFLIADTGIGISKESISNIFDRYYRISKNHLGSGVGLALVKSLTQLHKGNISVYSERYKGTEILVALPWGKENFQSAEVALPGSETTLSQLELLDSSILIPVQQNGQDHKHLNGKMAKHILLVDDNAELRAFLRQSLESYYYIEEAEDGNTAIALATNQIPDLIISDVMMPGMSGIELCKLIKDKFETSHIPFIILSAKDALDTKIEGMESGADYYFAKPLSIDLLLLTVHNIFEQGQKLKQKYTNDYLTEATELVHSEKDKDFVNKLLDLIEKNIQEPTLDVDFLCNHLFISRTKLYQKIKSISDQSVGEFIKTIRLKKAIQIMTHEDIALNKIADRIGLQSHSYFSRVFKKEFGKSPSEFMQSLRKNVNGQEQDEEEA